MKYFLKMDSSTEPSTQSKVQLLPSLGTVATDPLDFPLFYN